MEGGFGHAVDLVKYIREQYGDYFSIGVAGTMRPRPPPVAALPPNPLLTQNIGRPGDQGTLRATLRPRLWTTTCGTSRPRSTRAPTLS